MKLTDREGRVHDTLRVSVTDRCNLRCAYCLPEEPEWFPRREILRYEEIERLVGILAGEGVRKVRITGAEPLVRKDLERLIAKLSAIPGIDDLAMTTNGVLLGPAAESLAAAGLRRVNVSLDTLDPQRFLQLTKRDVLSRVLDGLAAAERAGLHPIRINTVLMRGLNEDEAESFVERARESNWEVRFIEYMPLQNGGTWNLDRVVSGGGVLERIGARWPLEPDPDTEPGSPSRRYRFRDGRGAVGFINGVTEPFCRRCSRLRITADGKLRACLHDPAEADLKGPMRGGADEEAIRSIVRAVLSEKGAGGGLEMCRQTTVAVPSRTMHRIGG